MLSNYTFRRYKDVYYLGNSDPIGLSYTLSKLVNCNNYVPVTSGTIPAATANYIVPIVGDGDYNLVITRGGDSITIVINNFINIQRSLISNIKEAICGNKQCINCDEQGLDDCVNYQGLFSQIIGYQYIIKPYSPDYCLSGNLVDAYLHQAMDLTKCKNVRELYGQLISEAMTGRVTNCKELVTYFASIYYLVFYQYERLIAVDNSEEAYVDAKYYWTQVQGCINNLGIDTNSLQVLFDTLITTSANRGGENCGGPTVGNVSHNFTYNTGLQTYVFSESDFTTNFADANGFAPNIVKILNNTFSGKLYFDGLLINGENFTFPIAEANRLSYEYTPTETNLIYDKIFFQINDNSTNPKYSNMGTISIAVTAYVNQPPDHVGNNSIAITNRVNRVFTLADFTSATTPPYHDPEGDGVYQLRIDTLPAVGTLKVSGSAATVGQIINASLIISGGFEYDAPNQDAAASVSFNFSLADTGSHTFVS